MSLAQTGMAVGSVSRFLAAALTTALWNVPPYSPKISVERPQAEAAGTATAPRINLFLYELEIDGAMRNIPLTPGSQPPLWMVLRYLVTAFDGNGESDTPESHDLLGMALQALMGIGDALPGDAALKDNPEPLKITFGSNDPELLSRLMQGPDDKYRCSAAFEVRPVLIARPQLPAGLQLVGVDYAAGTEIGLAGVKNFVLPSMGPQVESARPLSVELGDTLMLLGSGLDAPDLAVQFGPASLVPNMQQPQALSVVVAGLDPATTSAGNVSVYVSQTLASGLAISSGIVAVALLPTVAGMTIVSIARVSAANPNVYGAIGISGKLLGGAGDYVELALVKNGAVTLMLDAPDASFTPPGDQSQQQFAIPSASAVAQGAYFAVLRVNGQQARQAFTLNLVTP